MLMMIYSISISISISRVYHDTLIHRRDWYEHGHWCIVVNDVYILVNKLYVMYECDDR